MANDNKLSLFVKWLIGEQLRLRMHTEKAGLIQDRKYHLRKYPTCFVGMDTVEWLCCNNEAMSRDSAVKSMRILQKHGVFHHVCDEHMFKDEYLFYRFRKDDATWFNYKSAKLFQRGEDIFTWLCQKDHKNVEGENTRKMKNIENVRCTGLELTELLVKFGDTNATGTVHKLIHSGLITSDDSDSARISDQLYSFQLNYTMRRSLKDVLTQSDLIHQASPHSSRPINFSGRRRESAPCTRIKKMSSPPRQPSLDDCLLETVAAITVTPGLHIVVDRPTLEPPEDKTILEMLEEPTVPFIKQSIRMYRDSVGYGFTIRGQGPTHVKTVDPLGPAAAVGIRENQYIFSVNGKNVLRHDHKEVARQISLTDHESVDLVLMEQV